MPVLNPASASLIAVLLSILPNQAIAQEAVMTSSEPLREASHFRVARPTNDLAPLRRFYVDGLGLEVVAEFHDHDGFDGLILSQPGSGVQVEFTVAHSHPAPRAPSEDHLIVFYLPRPELHRSLVERMRTQGYSAVKSFNPYWDHHGVTYQDPDGYRVVLVNGAFPPQ